MKIRIRIPDELLKEVDELDTFFGNGRTETISYIIRDWLIQARVSINTLKKVAKKVSKKEAISDTNLKKLDSAIDKVEKLSK